MRSDASLPTMMYPLTRTVGVVAKVQSVSIRRAFVATPRLRAQDAVQAPRVEI